MTDKQYRYKGKFARVKKDDCKNYIRNASKKETVTPEYSSNVGRRILDIDILGRDMWCTACDIPLSSRFHYAEKIIGLASVFSVKCSKCQAIYEIRTSTYNPQKSSVQYHINMKLAVAKLDAGIGERNLNSLLSGLNIPTVNPGLLKRHERFVGPVIETVAKTSCLEALRTEKQLTIAHNRHMHGTKQNIDSEINSFLNNARDDSIGATISAIPCETLTPLSVNSPNLSLFPISSEHDMSQTASEDHLNVTPVSNLNRHDLLNSTKSTAVVTSTIENCDWLKVSEPLIQPNINIQSNNNESVGIISSYDAGWQKKGSGRCYNCSTGHGTAFGFFSKKCIGYATRNKNCRHCVLGNKDRSHDCRLNFHGSSKAMEEDMAVEIFTRNEHFKKENVHLNILIGDEDSCTIENLRQEANHLIAKWADKNHVTAKLTRKLYDIKSLSAVARKYFKYCFNCAVEKNKSNVEGTRDAILNIVPHAFGKHDKCGSWCGYNNDPVNFRHKILPGGKPLTGDKLEYLVTPVFEQLAKNAERISPCGSSQINENANMIISQKVPKTKSYGTSSSNNFRVGGGVCQINIGRTYVDRVYEKCALSPLKNKSLEYRLQRDRVKKQREQIIKTIKFKKRRRELLNKKISTMIRNERREGITYQSNCGLNHIDFTDKQFVNTLSQINDGTVIVVFDIETTDLKKTDQIVQIAAKADDKILNKYILPTCAFTISATTVTGLRIHDGDMYLNSVPLLTESPKKVLSAFISFLRSLNSSVVLAAHNGFKFDFPRILQLLKEYQMIDEFISIVAACVDTLPLFKSKLKNRRAEKKSFSQSNLCDDYLGPQVSADAHNAACDVSNLEQLIYNTEIGVSRTELIDTAVSIQSLLNKEHDDIIYHRNLNSLQILIKNDKIDEINNMAIGISKNMVTKIAKVGINVEHMQRTYSNDQIEGIEILLGLNVGKGARVTTNRKVIKSLADKLEMLKNNSQAFYVITFSLSLDTIVSYCIAKKIIFTYNVLSKNNKLHAVIIRFLQ